MHEQKAVFIRFSPLNDLSAEHVVTGKTCAHDAVVLIVFIPETEGGARAAPKYAPATTLLNSHSILTKTPGSQKM